MWRGVIRLPDQAVRHTTVYKLAACGKSGNRKTTGPKFDTRTHDHMGGWGHWAIPPHVTFRLCLLVKKNKLNGAK